MTTGDLAARTFRELRAPQWRRLALFWFASVFVGDVAYAVSHPPGPKVLAGLIALGVSTFLLLLWMASASLRRSAAGPRSPWRIDGSLLFYIALNAGLAAADWLWAPYFENWSTYGTILIGAALPLLLALPLAPWLVAVAVERPLAVSPWPFLRRADAWFPPLLLLTSVLILPLALAQIWAFLALFGPGRGAVEFALLHSALSTVSAILGLALALVAYRSVAEA